MTTGESAPQFRVGHLTTVDLSLRFLVHPQLLAVSEWGGEPVGISAPGPWVEGLEADGIRHVSLSASTRGMSPMNDLRAAIQLWRVLRREQLTVLHTHNPKPGLYGRVLGRLAGVPLVVNTLHGMYVTESDRAAKRLLVYAMEAVAARFSDVELHQNPEDLDLCTRKRILPRGKGSLLGNGVDLSRFDPERVDPETRRRLRAEWGAGEDQVVIGMVGRMVNEKGYPELFEAVAGLGDGYVTVVAGPEDPEKSDAVAPEVIERAREAGVVFLGMRTDVDDLYGAMDIFVLPSHREGFPRAAMEAAATGLPIIATDVRGCRQVVDHEVNGLLVPLREPTALREAIATIGGDETMRRRMSEASIAKARSEFDEKRVVDIVMSSYRDGLTDKGLGHLLPAAALSDTEDELVFRSARADDARALAALHMSQIDTGFLPTLGKRFMTVLYRALSTWPGAVVEVAADEGGPVGFVSGVEDVGAFYRDFARRFGLRACLAALPRLVRPSVVRRAWESFRYGGQEHDVVAELLSMAVAPRARRKGLANRLGLTFLAALRDRGVEGVRVVVGSDNEAAINAYSKMGFAPHSQVEVHVGEISEVLVWRP